MPQLHPTPAGPRLRVISDNDYAGDPDALFQLAHLALSPSVDLRGIIASHLSADDPFDGSGRSAANGVAEASAVLDLLGIGDEVSVVAGRETPIGSREQPEVSAAAELIVAEAMRTDTRLPLYVTAGGGLSAVATAYLLEPRIAGRLTVVWIGGPEHVELGAIPPPGAAPLEYNLDIDLLAAQVVFASAIPLWQVPRNAYRQALVSTAELRAEVRRHGRVGQHLYERLDRVAVLAAGAGHHLGETYILGDNPLVLLTALMSSFEMDPSSSAYDLVSRPRIDDHGQYRPCPGAAPMRVYSRLDVRLMLQDMYAKLAGHAAREARIRSRTG